MTTLTAPRLGFLIFVIDESSAMNSRRAANTLESGDARSLAVNLATAINARLREFSDAGWDCDVSIVGYRSSSNQTDVGVRWGGGFSGRDWIPAHELKAGPLSVEKRSRKDSAETIAFPIWYVPLLGEGSPQVAAFTFVRQLIERWAVSGSPGIPVIIHFASSASSDGNPHHVIQQIQQLGSPSGAPLVMHAHFGAGGEAPAICFPANRAYLPQGPIRDWFDRSSMLPESLILALRQRGETTNEKARGLIYNARMVNIVQLLELLREFQIGTSNVHRTSLSQDSDSPSNSLASERAIPSESQSARPERIVFVLDRSAGDPSSSNLRNSCVLLQSHLNKWLNELAINYDCQVGLVTYGADSTGEPDVRVGFEGPIAGAQLVYASEISKGSVREESYEETVPDGVGGVFTMPRKRMVLVEVEPSGYVAPDAAFQEVRRLLDGHSSSSSPSVVVHLTRGACSSAEADAARAQLDGIDQVTLYHLVVTEQPAQSFSYPDPDVALPSVSLDALLRVSSPLLHAEKLAAGKRCSSASARGLVVNGEFDLLLDALVGSKNK